MTAALPHHLVWLRQDLRLADNTALAAAARDPSCRVSLVYLVTPRQWQAHDVAPLAWIWSGGSCSPCMPMQVHWACAWWC